MKKRHEEAKKAGRSTLAEAAEAEKSGDLADVDTWVQCDDCLKWRMLPASAFPLPAKWMCRLNRASLPDGRAWTCAIPEEKDPDSRVVATDGMYVVERLLDLRKRKNVKQYLVRWSGFDAADDTWEPESNLDPELTFAFRQQRARSAAGQSHQKRQAVAASDGSAKRHKGEGEAASTSADGAAAESDLWVECCKCAKWRRLPFAPCTALPTDWHCKLNPDLLHNDCSHEEEQDEEEEAEDEAEEEAEDSEEEAQGEDEEAQERVTLRHGPGRPPKNPELHATKPDALKQHTELVKRLKAHTEMYQLTQLKMAAVLNLTVTTLSMWFRFRGRTSLEGRLSTARRLKGPKRREIDAIVAAYLSNEPAGGWAAHAQAEVPSGSGAAAGGAAVNTTASAASAQAGANAMRYSAQESIHQGASARASEVAPAPPSGSTTARQFAMALAGDAPLLLQRAATKSLRLNTATPGGRRVGSERQVCLRPVVGSVGAPPMPPPRCRCGQDATWAYGRWFCSDAEGSSCGFEAVPPPLPLTPCCDCGDPSAWVPMLRRWCCHRFGSEGGCHFELHEPPPRPEPELVSSALLRTPTPWSVPVQVTSESPSAGETAAAGEAAGDGDNGKHAMIAAAAANEVATCSEWAFVAPTTNCGLGLFARSALARHQAIGECKCRPTGVASHTSRSDAHVLPSP